MCTTDCLRQRKRLVDRELREFGIQDESVLSAMNTIPREEFVANDLREFAYRNTPLSIEAGQTISQSLIVAWMTTEQAEHHDSLPRFSRIDR